MKKMLASCSVILLILLLASSVAGCQPQAVQHYNRGVELQEEGNYEQAILEYTNAIELDPNFADAYYNRGIAYKNKGEFDNAIADYSRAIELDPNHTWAYYNRGNAYILKGEFDNAIADFNKVIEVSTNPDIIQAAREMVRELEGH